MALCVMHKLETIQFCSYPQPEVITYDNGKEFLGCKFQELLDSYDICGQPTTVKNPATNGLIAWVHLTIGD